MPKKASDFLKDQLIKAGVKLDDEANKAIKDALALPELGNINLPDEIINPIDNGLLSIEAAKNGHPLLKPHYFSQAYDGLDKELNKFLEDHQIPDDVKSEINQERSSTKRAVLLAAKIKSLEEKKATSGKGEKDQLQAQINDLHNQLRSEKESINKIKADYEKKLRDKDMSYALNGLLGQYKTIYDELSHNIKDTTLKAIIENSLSTDEAEFIINDSGQLTLQKKDGSNFFGDNHQQLTPKTYLDKVLSREKILKVNDPNPGAKLPPKNGSTPPPASVPGKNANKELQSLVSETLASLEQSSNGVL
jgi:hypothetical protein